MHPINAAEDCARALSRRVNLDIAVAEEDSSGLSNIGASVKLDDDIRLAVYWLFREDMEALNVADLELLRPQKDQLIIATPVISARTATRWRKLGFQYMDASGNACINNQGYHIVSVGHQPASSKVVSSSPDGKTGKSFQPSGLKVIFSLLNNEELVSSSLRTISENSGVSLGSTSAVYKDLLAHGYIRKQGKYVELSNKQQLIERWAEAYPYQIRNKKLIGHFTSDDPGWWKNIENLSGFQFSGEIAARELSNYLNPRDGLVYLNKKNQTDLIRTARLRRIKSEEKPEIRIDLYEGFWLLENDRVTAPPLVIYSDLIETGDSRNMDVASRIKEAFLD